MWKALSGGTVYDLKIHLVLVTKYRYKVINRPILERLREIFTNTCSKWECELIEFSGESDHVHLVISYHPKLSLDTFVGNLKTVSSRLIRKEFEEHVNRFYRKKVFWKIGYSVNSCGGASLDKIKEYVRGQKVPD
jgi:putative transposase